MSWLLRHTTQNESPADKTSVGDAPFVTMKDPNLTPSAFSDAPINVFVSEAKDSTEAPNSEHAAAKDFSDAHPTNIDEHDDDELSEHELINPRPEDVDDYEDAEDREPDPEEDELDRAFNSPDEDEPEAPGENGLTPEEDAFWDDVLHFDPNADEPDKLDYLEALANRLAGSSDDEAEPEPIYREDIQCVQALCTRPFGTGCDRCATACPHGAITFDDEGLPQIVDEYCTNCGICAGVCDGFSSVRIMLTDLAERTLDIARDGLAVSFACNDMIPAGQDPADNVVLVPCLAYLPPEFLTFVLAHDVRVNVCCDFGLCAECQVAGHAAADLYNHVITAAQAWSGKEIGFLPYAPTQQSIIEDLLQDAQAEGDRRNMLAGIGSTMAEVATGERRQRTSSSVFSFQENMERMRASGHIKQHEGLTLEELTADHRIPKYWPRRKLALEAAQECPEVGKRMSLWVATIDGTLCTQSHACVNVCPTGARQIDEDDMVKIDVSYCIACGACAAACPTGACDFAEADACQLAKIAGQVS